MANLWSKFFNLLPKAPRYVGTVTAINVDDTYTVTLEGGGELIVMSTTTFAVSDRVFVRDGKIEGKAPTLPFFTVDV